MKQKYWLMRVLPAGLLLISLVCLEVHCGGNNEIRERPQSDNSLRHCLACRMRTNNTFFVAENFNCFVSGLNVSNRGDTCIVFLQKNGNLNRNLNDYWPQMKTESSFVFLYLSKWHTKQKMDVVFLQGQNCSTIETTCHRIHLYTKTICENVVYEDAFCQNMENKDKYIIDIDKSPPHCSNCDNPVKPAKENITLAPPPLTEGGELNSAEAVKIIDNLASLVTSLNESSAAFSAGEAITGVIVRETEPEDVDEVSFAYSSHKDNLNIISDRNLLTDYSRSVTVSKEAFEQAVRANVSVPFVAVLRFMNMSKDELNSNVLADEVIALEMGTIISNLNETININFKNMDYKGTPSCHSWNGEGVRPNWTEEGCVTLTTGINITCQCSHLTFFAILLTPLNETVSSSDLRNLTIITQVGCGLSMFFLSVVLFMHFILRMAKTNNATGVLIQQVLAMLLLNFTFLINSFVARLKSYVGCKIMAAVMNYFLLATFTWFAVQAFHLCLRMHMGGVVVLRRYLLKVSIISWGIPSVIIIVLLILGKYGEQVINTSNPDDSVSMCWITDSKVHYIVNIGFYVLVFIFTFSVFIIILSWVICLKRTKAANAQVNRHGISILTIMGLCCILGVTWGFAFFAHGILEIPSYYIFTVLNSFQGFFLFIYYYNSRNSREKNNSTDTTNQTGLDIIESPYDNLPEKTIKAK